MKTGFPGFSKEALQFLRALEKNNQREWFQPRKEEFEAKLKTPMTDLVIALNSELARFAPQYVTDPKKSIFRIYRDTRFSADKTPYKTQIAASFHHRGLVETGGAGLYVSLCHKQLEIGGGLYHPSPDVLIAVRTHLTNTHEQLRSLLGDRKRKKLCGELRGDCLTRVPKGFAADHPAADLLKMKDLFLFVELPPETSTGPSLWKEVVSRFELIAPVLDYLNTPLLSKKAKAAKNFLS